MELSSSPNPIPFGLQYVKPQNGITSIYECTHSKNPCYAYVLMISIVKVSVWIRVWVSIRVNKFFYV